MLPVLFFLSGFVALGLETVWFRSLLLVFGASHQAAGTLLGVFMAGIVVGGEAAGRLADRLRSPARGYGLAEVAVGLFALTSPLLFAAVGPAALAASGPGRVALAFALLAIPTIAMGASLPFLTRALAPDRDHVGPTIRLLYAINLAGATAGAAATGFWILPSIGLHATTLVLGALGLAGGLVAVALARGPAGARTATQAPRPAATSAVAHLAVVLAASAGFVSFALQVAWNRAFASLLGSSSFTFTLVVAVILAALAAGGALGHAESDPRPYWTRVTRRLFVLAIAGYLGTLVAGAAPAYLAWAVTHGIGTGPLRLLCVALVVAVPAYQIGALFPTLAARFPTAGVGRTAGTALAATTAGNLAGALAAGFVLVPTLGARTTLVASSALALGLACVASSRTGRARFAGTLIASAAAVGIAALVPSWDRIALSAGTYRTALYRQRHEASGTDCGPGRRFTHNELLFFRDGRIGAVAVIGHRGLDPAEPCSLYSLRVDGKTEGSVFVAAPLGPRVPAGARELPTGDLPTEILAGLLPGAGGPSRSDALVVGWGTGISVRALLDTGRWRVTAVEIEPAVLDAARLFDAPLLDDPRVRIEIDDARVALRRSAPGSLDAIVSQPSNPWVAGSSALFSREYFALLHDRLRPGGRALVWVQLYETDRETVRSVVATLLCVFPDVHAFRPALDSRDLLLLARRSDRPSSTAALAGDLARLDARGFAQLRRAGFDGAAALVRAHVADAAALARWSSGAPVSTDDNALVEVRVARHLLAGTADPPDAILAGL